MQPGLDSLKSIVEAYQASKRKAQESAASSSEPPKPEATSQNWRCACCKAEYEASDAEVPKCFNCGAYTSFDLYDLTFLQTIFEGMAVMLKDSDFVPTPEYWTTDRHAIEGRLQTRQVVKIK